MTIFSTVPLIGLIATRPSVERATLPRIAQYQIERLTESVFYRKSGLRYKSVLMVDLGGNTSSLWVATGVASVLGKATHNMVHVLSVGGSAPEIKLASEERDSDSGSVGYILEHIAEPSSTLEGLIILSERLSTIKADGLMTIVHLFQSNNRNANFSHLDFIDGVILLVRATQTRRATLAMLERQLAMAGTPLLGAVLLDRDYPIPENLYRLF
jgi:hypothetical protein